MAKFIVTAFNPANGQRARLHYDNATSELISESGEPLVQRVEVAARVNAPAVSKQTPLAKTSPRVLKISLGLSCNYACEYCSQRFVPRADETNPGNVQAFIDGLGSWVTSPPERVEFWGGEPMLYWHKIKILAPALRERFPPAQRIRLPMRPGNRSLNLSNAVAVTVFEAWRQQGYDGGA